MTTIDTTALRALAEKATPGPLTDEEWREYQAIPDQGYSHRAWMDRKIASRSPLDRGTTLALLDRLAEAEADRAEALARMAAHRCHDRAEAAYGRVLDLEDQIKRVREVHRPVLEPGTPILCCAACGVPVESEPCATIRALDGEVPA